MKITSALGCFLMFAANFLCAPSVQAELRLNPWSEELYAQVEKEFGPAASKRMRDLYGVIQANKDKPVREKLRAANDTLNNVPWISDREKWNADDYWATPMETLTQFGGDCEDMAIGKYMMLRLMGVPTKNLYLGYGKHKRTGEFHMVLVWANDDRSQSLVLDNLERQMLPGKERRDLLGIYMTDAAGNLILLNDDGSKRNIKSEFSNRKLEKLQALKRAIVENNQKYKQYNGGVPPLAN